MVVRLRLARFGRRVCCVLLFPSCFSLHGVFLWIIPIGQFQFYFLQNLPFYRIFAADSRSPRDGRHLENVGYYDPIPQKDGNKHIGLDIERIKYWLSVGAQPSRTVSRLLSQAGIIPKSPAALSHGSVRNPDKRNKTRVTSSDTENTDQS